jgi:putative membrane protein
VNRRIRISEEDQVSLAQAVKEAELRTSGELVPVILQESDAYVRARWIWVSIGGGLGTLAAILLHEWSRYQNWADSSQMPALYHLLLYQFLGSFGGWVLSGFWFFRRRVLTTAQMRKAVDLKTKALFVETGLSQTRDRTGVLILVSLFERRVQILADEGIHSRVPDGFWDAEVKQIVQAIHDGRFIQGFSSVIQQIGEKLSENFPRKADDRNELSNKPRVEG